MKHVSILSNISMFWNTRNGGIHSYYNELVSSSVDYRLYQWVCPNLSIVEFDIDSCEVSAESDVQSWKNIYKQNCWRNFLQPHVSLRRTVDIEFDNRPVWTQLMKVKTYSKCTLFVLLTTTHIFVKQFKNCFWTRLVNVTKL